MNPITIPGAEPFFLPAGKVGCLLVHGFTGTPKEMRLMGDHLQQNGITAYGVRLAGHGTDINDMPRMRWRDWLASVEDGFHTIQGSCDQVFIAGLSMGGILSLLAASYLPLRGAIAMATPYELSIDWRIRFAKQLSVLVPFVAKGKDDVSDQEMAKQHIDYPAYPTRSIAEVVALLEQTRATLAQISIPILMVNSRADSTVPEQHQEQYARHLAGKTFRPFMLDRSGHVITEDVDRERVFRHVLDFINEFSQGK